MTGPKAVPAAHQRKRPVRRVLTATEQSALAEQRVARQVIMKLAGLTGESRERVFAMIHAYTAGQA